MALPKKKIPKKAPDKKCFLITPIGDKGTDIRKRVDQWMEYIYAPALEENYELIRADKIHSPGRITEQVLDNIIDCDLAVIDYTGLNSNVMYEAAVRHISKKPFIQIHPHGQNIPFDIKDFRSIEYDPAELKYPDKLVVAIEKANAEINSKKYRIPEILKHEFDLERITADPEKFVDLLVKRLGISGKDKIIDTSANIETSTGLNIPMGIGAPIPISDSWGSIFGSRSREVLCTNCGTINNVASGITFGISNRNRCQHCDNKLPD